MRRFSARTRRLDLLWPGLLLLGAVVAVAWAGIGNRYGRQWYVWLFRHRPAGIIIHHTASDGHRNGKLLDAAMVDADHAGKGWGTEYGGKTYHIAYHYLILADGKVEPGRPEGAPGAHTSGHNSYLGVCLVGNFSSTANPDVAMQPAVPTDAQMASLTALLRELMRKYDFTVEDIHRHRDFCQTSCPGDRFPFDKLIESLKGPQPTASPTGDASGSQP
jgi:hypothetical protein